MSSLKIRQGVRTPSGFAADALQRARKVVTPSSGIVRGKFPSRKNGRMVHHEGLLERDAFYWLEATPEVVAYREQPTTLYYPDGERLRRYTPDLELTLQSGELIYVEIKPAAIVIRPKVSHKLGRIAQHLSRTGPRFLVWTDQMIRQQPQLDNLRWIYQRLQRFSQANAAVSLALLSPLLPCSLKEADAQLKRRRLDVFALLLDGQLSWCTEESVSQQTEVELATGASNLCFNGFSTPSEAFPAFVATQPRRA